MGFLSWLGFGDDLPTPPPTFVVDENSIDPAVFGLASYALPTAPAPRIDRRSAMQVPAVKRGRDLICGSIGGLPLVTVKADFTRLDRQPLLDQPEPSTARSVTMTKTVEDMLFEGIAWWRVKDRDSANWPTSVERLEPRDVEVDKEKNQVRVRGSEVPDRDLIRFDGPTDGLLIAGARAIRTCLQLDAAAASYSDEPLPLGYFSPAEGADPLGDTDEEEDAAITELLDAWGNARRSRATGYVPAALTYNPVQFNPEQLQLADQRQHAVLEISRILGLDAEDLGVSTTSRTYFNAESRRRDRIDFTLGPFMKAISDRLSMGDVTPRGQSVQFDLEEFLKSDTKTRYESYQLGLSAGAITKEEIRVAERKPALPETDTPEVPAVQPIDPASNVRQLPAPPVAAAADQRGVGFADELGITLDATTETGAVFAVDTDKRTITGLAVPYGKIAYHDGVPYQFSAGTIDYGSDPSRVKLWIDHDRNRAIGYALSFTDTPAGLVGKYQVDRSPEGDQALQKASDKVWDGLSIGLARGAKFAYRDGVQFATHAPLRETSLTPSPAFDDARVSSVALTADTERNYPMTDTTVAPAAEAPQTPAPVGLPATFSEDLAAAIADGFAQIIKPQLGELGIVGAPGGPAVIPAAGGAAFTVKEEAPYRFDGSTKGEHCFTDDLREAWNGNSEAKQRIEQFMEEAHEQFAVTTGNAAAMNPTQNRPDLYVPQLRYTRPLFEMVTTGVLTDKTPFTVPKFGAAAGLAGDHTEGVEPTPGSFSATMQTVQPTAISGKVEINREVWDQGGNPQTDTIVWNEMQNAYFEAIEAKIAAMLNAIPAANLYSGAEINLAGATNAALNTALTTLLVNLQFVRGGNRYTAAAASADLFGAIAGAVDSAGRPLFPLLGPANANGTIANGAVSANILGQTFRPAWALNAGVANARNSYLFVPTSVYQWASAPKRFTFEYQVKSVDMAVWGYTGGAVLRESDVARIDHTTADV